MDGRIEKGKETKERIIKATLELISKDGIRTLSANKIAKVAGMSKSNIFHHFSSVDALPILALEYLIEQLMKGADVVPKDSLKETLIEIGAVTLKGNVEEQSHYRALFVLYNESFYDDRYKALINEMKDAFTQGMVDLITGYHPQVSDEADLDYLAKMITIILDGFGYHYMTDHQPQKFMMMWEMQVDMICEKIKLMEKNI